MSADSSKGAALRQLIRNNLGFLTTSALAFGLAGPALAQQSDAKDPADKSEELSEITVTGAGQRALQRLQFIR